MRLGATVQTCFVLLDEAGGLIDGSGFGVEDGHSALSEVDQARIFGGSFGVGFGTEGGEASAEFTAQFEGRVVAGAGFFGGLGEAADLGDAGVEFDTYGVDCSGFGSAFQLQQHDSQVRYTLAGDGLFRDGETADLIVAFGEEGGVLVAELDECAEELFGLGEVVGEGLALDFEAFDF